MSKPKNPDTIIVKNKMYPAGLTEEKVWTYYQHYKGIILNNTRGKDLMFAIMVDINKPIIKRHGTAAKLIRLNNNNYEETLTGRTISIYSTMNAYEDFGIIDIDTSNWNQAIDVTGYIYDIMDKSNFINNLKILYTGKQAFHIHCQFQNKLPINRIKSLLLEHIQQNWNPQMFTIQHKRTPNKPNIDLSPNKFRGAYITEGSLSIWGLKCMRIEINKLKSFKQWRAKI